MPFETARPQWSERLTARDIRALTPLIWEHVNPYGRFEHTHQQRLECLGRHISGDWGVVCAEDRKANFEALFDDRRILSAYPIDPTKPSKGFGENTLRIITEADRSATTFLLPSEY